MKKYRVVEFSQGGFGIQCKNHRFSFWKLLPNEPIRFLNGALMEIERLKKVEEEEINKKKMFEIKTVVKYN
jgi:hypothetical protein